MGALSSIGRTNQEADFPYLTSVDGERYITNVKDQDLIGYKYLNLSKTKVVEVIYKAAEDGTLELYTGMDGEKKAEISLKGTSVWVLGETRCIFGEDDRELYMVYKGSGGISLLTLNLKDKEV